MRRLLCLLVLAGCSDAGVTKFNSTPTAAITSHADGDRVLEGAEVELVGSVSDSNHEFSALGVAWRVGGIAVCEGVAVEADGAVRCPHVIAPGDELVVLEVRDPEGEAGRASVSLEIVETDAPVATITAPSDDARLYSDALVVLAGTATDAEDDATALVAAWSSSLDGDLAEAPTSPDSTGVLEGAVGLSEGEHLLTLTVVDTSGKIGRDTRTVQVGAPNSAPTCGIDAPLDGAVGLEGDVVTFSATVADVDEPPDSLSVDWSSDRQGALGSSAADSAGAVTFPFAGLDAGVHVVRLEVVDELGLSCVDDVVYTVGTRPTVRIDVPGSGDVVNEGATVVFSGAVGDAEDAADSLVIGWESDVDGVLSALGADASGAVGFQTDSLSSGAHVVTLSATDSHGFSASTTVDLVVNALPTAPTVSVAPDPAVTSDDLVATASGSTDPDASGTVTYRYDWYEDGVLSTASVSDTFPASATSRDRDYRVVVTPNDGTGDGPPGEATRTVDNSAPTAPVVVVSPASPLGVDDLVCTLGTASTDIDGDAVAYTIAWTRDGSAWTGTTSSTTLSGDTIAAADTRHDEDWVCTVTPDDGTDAGPSGADGVTVTGFTGWPDDDDVDASDTEHVFRGDDAGDRSGTDGALVDLDGDGFSDVVIAAPSDERGVSGGGAVSVWWGATLGSPATHTMSDADVVILGVGADDAMGTQVRAGGDVDGDGLPELLVSGGAATSAAATSRTWVFSGADLSTAGATISASSAMATIDGASLNDYATAAASIGDVDGDGRDDLAIGAWGDDSGGFGSGSVSIFLGGSVGAGSALDIDDADLQIQGDANLWGCGVHVAAAGDVDADGLDDMLIGCHRYDTQRGRVFVVTGAAMGTAAAVVSVVDVAAACVEGTAQNDYLGRAVMGVGDVDGDGWDDVAIAAPWEDGEGRVHLLGGADLTSTSCVDPNSLAIATLSGATSSRFGWELAADDVDGDGEIDLAVGAWGEDPGAGTDAGTALLFLDLASADGRTAADADLRVEGEAGEDVLGYFVALGDVDGDGFSDLLAGARAEDTNGTDSGQASLVLTP